MSLLLQLLQSGDFSLLKQALGDRLHQPFRQKLVPGLEQALHLEHEDLLGVCLSGSGPSIVAFAEDNLQEISDLLASVYEALGIGYQIRTLTVHQASLGQGAEGVQSRVGVLVGAFGLSSTKIPHSMLVLNTA